MSEQAPMPENEQIKYWNIESVLKYRAELDLMRRVGTWMRETHIDSRGACENSSLNLSSGTPRDFYKTRPPVTHQSMTAEQKIMQAVTDAYIAEQEGDINNPMAQALQAKTAPYEPEYTECMEYYADLLVSDIALNRTCIDQSLAISTERLIVHRIDQTIGFTLDYVYERAS